MKRRIYRIAGASMFVDGKGGPAWDAAPCCMPLPQRSGRLPALRPHFVSGQTLSSSAAMRLYLRSAQLRRVK